MSDRGDGQRRLPPMLSTSELQNRRTAWRRRRARRRLAWSVLLVAVVAAGVVAVLLPGGASRPAGGTTIASPVPPPDLDGAAGRHDRRTDKLEEATAPGAIVRVLGYTSYVRVGSAGKRDVALTFDDGPGLYTPQILGVLRRTRTPATFFVIGEWARRYPQLVRVEARDGFEVGDHTETHPFMSLLSATEQQAQIAAAAQGITRAGAPFPHLWRPPYGAFNTATLQVLRALRMLMVLWTVDTSDYARPGVARIVYVAVSGARPGAIILMHDGGGDRAETVAALPRIIAALRRRGYRLVTVAQLLADDPPARDQPAPQPLSGRG
jgi:peptidoglycan-N-acetylglucosamine deacetylase